MNASNVRTSSTPATSSTLRPRTNRLISGLDDDDNPSFALNPPNHASLGSPLDSRSASPIPSTGLPRQSRTPGWSSPGTRGGSASLGRASGSRARQTGQQSPTSIAGLWGSSWSALQNIASDLLANDAAPEATSSNRSRGPLSKLQRPRTSTSAPPSQWGPRAPTSQPSLSEVGVGTREDQRAALRAQKRKDLLTQRETSYADTLGKFKRRISDEHASLSAPPGEHEERDALIYLHPVGKNDTLAGITIKYNCSANVLRKANRMWPNDTVQSRKVIILPVDACAVKGRPLPGPEAIDLLSSESDALSAGQAEEVVTLDQTANVNIGSRPRTNSSSTNASKATALSGAHSGGDTETSWQHDSWVLLPGSTKPTEIGRLPRRALGYFPPARRKSNSYSDFDTPSTSLDLVRSNVGEVLASSPLRADPPQRPPRTRRLSNANNGYFPSYLAGPGGVGTMNSNVHFPGPAQDGLNKMFAKHLPDVAPPKTQQSLLTPEFPAYTDYPTPTCSGASTPGLGRNLNIENVGGAIEHWMRRMASKANDSMKPTERQKMPRSSVGTPGRGAGGIGDLIEMTDEFEIGDDEEDEAAEAGRGRRGSEVRSIPPSSTATSYFDGPLARERLSVGQTNAAKAGKAGKAD